MAQLIPVQYENLKYPENIIPSVGEISVKFRNSMNDIKDSIRKMKERDVRYFSLHTQEPHTGDKIVKDSINSNPSSIVVKDNLVNIRESPTYLWSSREWIDDFIIFLNRVSESFDDKNSVRVIELHTPINKKYINSIDTFIDKLKSFYDVMSPVFPTAEFVVENSYQQPLLYKVEEINEFSDKINELGKDNYKIGIALDIPQLLYATELRYIGALGEKIEDLFRSLESSKDNIRSIHLSGAKGKDHYGHSHNGDLNTLFDHGNTNGNQEERENVRKLKGSLLKGISSILSDKNKRYFVPELKRGQDSSLKSIISDLEEIGVEFDHPLP
jgi:hypothetical protein